MDLLWRVVSSVLISGRSHNVRCAFDEQNDRLIIHDDSAPCERRRIVGWGKLGRAFVSPETRERQDAAIEARDIYALRKDAGAAVHRACERIRIISQDSDSSRSVHVLWSSKVFTSGERVAMTFGPRAPFQQGMTMLVVVSSAITPWMRHLKHFFPFIREDKNLFDDVSVSRNLGTAYHAVDTPVRDSLSSDIPSPLATVVSPLPASQRSTTTGENNNNHGRSQQQQQHRNQPRGRAAKPSAEHSLGLDDDDDDHNYHRQQRHYGGGHDEIVMTSLSGTTPNHRVTRRPPIDTVGSRAETEADAAAAAAGTEGTPPEADVHLAEPCAACARRLPPSLVVFVEACDHVVCVECATACARYYAEVSLATTHNCPCPAARCKEMLHPHELRPLLSSHEWDTLEVNEMRIAVESGITCPSCRMVFDGHKVASVKDDPLENRFVCSMCDTSFCVSCGVHPFHEGRPCRDVTRTKGQPLCRYCGNPAVTITPTECCADPVCSEKAKRACSVSKPCGHLCHGTKGEGTCCSCLEPGCNVGRSSNIATDITCTDFCTICYVETLSEAPCLELACGHVFHTHCLEARLEHKWPTAAVSYRFLDCPLCVRPIAHQVLAPLLMPLQKARDALEARYIERLRVEGLLDHRDITEPSSAFYNAPVSWARRNLTYFECYQCKKPYFGGVRGCYAAAEDPEVENPPRDQLICAGCTLAASDNAGGGAAAACKEHGMMFLEFKCKYCCNLAVWYCWGTTHFCDACHNPPRKTVRLDCPGEELCPIQGRHPPNGTEYLIGCAVCRSRTAAAAAAAANNNNGSTKDDGPKISSNGILQRAAAPAAVAA